MKLIKNKSGFTLVELIVVIAILAILAGIAVPAYSGYIKKAKTTADTQTLAAIKTAVDSALITEGIVESIEVNTESNYVFATIDTKQYNLYGTPAIGNGKENKTTESMKDDFQLYMSGKEIEFEQDANKAVWTAEKNWVISKVVPAEDGD